MTAAITGVGALSSVGGSSAEIFAALCAGKSGIGEPKGFDLTRYRTRHAFEIDDRPAPGVDVPLRATRWLERVVVDALADAGLPERLDDVPVLIGTTLREIRSVELMWRDKAEFALADLHFGTALRKRFGATRTYTVANACSASLYALGLGVDLLATGTADTVVVAGVDTISESTYGLLDRCYPVAPRRLQPFDRARAGMLQGEGAAAVVLSREPVGRVHATVTGVAVNCDAYHPSAPHAASIAAAVREAHCRAGTVAEDIDLVLLHGTGTELNDEAEALVMREVFGSGGPLMTAMKCMTGHTAGASGLHSLLVAVESMRAGVVPPITTLDDPMPEAAGLRLVRDTAAPGSLRRAQVDSFGFGGLNAVAVIERPRE
ncbi:MULTISPECIES: beta-ketoacyl synthase N-terminal-like domain-containing protein [Amycolatopsis]|uniref:Beta-ketoacyl synthase N-terminal-like domain-containing protein n=1 Tax=Amycolatopsis albidoflavus TaxID=102226 RepID=A0ABW5I8A3_9PSEU